MAKFSQQTPDTSAFVHAAEIRVSSGVEIDRIAPILMKPKPAKYHINLRLSQEEQEILQAALVRNPGMSVHGLVKGILMPALRRLA